MPTRRSNPGSPFRRYWLCAIGLLLCSLLGMLAGNLWMERNFDQFESMREVSDDNTMSRFGRFFRHRFSTYEVAEVGKNHQSVKSAFEEVVEDANLATVRILSRGRQIALGAVIDNDGHVLTKASELKPSIRCQLHSGAEYEARRIAVDQSTDLALLKIDLPSTAGVPVAQFVDHRPALGDWLAVPGAIGDQPVVVGVASSMPREVKRHQGLLGVLLGVSSQGAAIDFIIPGSSAEQHGIEVGDVIFSADGSRVRSREELQAIVGNALPGDRVKFGIRRGDQEVFRSVTLGRRTFDSLGLDQTEAEHDGGPLSRRRSGFASIIQHDCPLTPNQCGGPLVNVDGQVIGMNIARASRVESYALPANVVRDAIDKLLASPTN